jgi:hypothetical protein
MLKSLILKSWPQRSECVCAMKNIKFAYFPSQNRTLHDLYYGEFIKTFTPIRRTLIFYGNGEVARIIREWITWCSVQQKQLSLKVYAP